jgi:hypothetical protein
MSQSDLNFAFLPGVPTGYVVERLTNAAGNEIGTGKLASPESSAALAINTFGWFHERPASFPLFSILPLSISPATLVEVEYCARFPWTGGTHPWLDAFIETPDAIVGVESKRFEPYRGARLKVELSEAYDRPVWHDRMGPYEAMRDELRTGTERFAFLDAAQLVKHAFGLVTDGRRKTKQPYLVYLFAEPREYQGQSIDGGVKQKHREEIARFALAVDGAEVGFGAMSYREWLASWPDSDPDLVAHRAAIIEHFSP